MEFLWWGGWLIAALVCAAMWYLVPFLIRKKAEEMLVKACRLHRAIVLTYDDGPSSALTPKLLDLLQKHGAKASFYVLGSNAKERSNVIALTLNAGHDVGSHTFYHSNAWKTSPWTYASDLEAGMDAVAKAGGKPEDFRPPFGKLTLAGLIHGRFRRLRYCWWTIDTRDSWARRPIADVLQEIDAKNGGVILMHDWDSYEKAPDYPSHIDHVLKLTESILELGKNRGLAVLSFSELCMLSAKSTAVSLKHRA
jgi:peptidoglycan-N-acetylglucosamine deacetylase